MNRALFFALILTCGEGHGAYWNSPANQLHPVQGLYVKPSTDGTTGDLYVAASEDSGVKAQWLTDQPVNFLPVAAASKPHQTTVPVTFTPNYPAPHDESVTAQKRAVVTSPPVQYAYAMPMSSGVPSENSMITPYPYVISASSLSPPSSSENSPTPQCVFDPASSNVPQYSPFHFFYPHMMSAFTNAMTVLKEAGLSEDTAGSIMSQATPMWPPSSYGYPMYVMVDPNAWAQNAQSQSQSVPSSGPANDS